MTCKQDSAQTEAVPQHVNCDKKTQLRLTQSKATVVEIILLPFEEQSDCNVSLSEMSSLFIPRFKVRGTVMDAVVESNSVHLLKYCTYSTILSTYFMLLKMGIL